MAMAPMDQGVMDKRSSSRPLPVDGGLMQWRLKVFT